MQSISFTQLKKRFQSVAGLATLDATDEFFLLNSLNNRLRDAWTRMDWPELINLNSVSISSDSTGNYVGSTGDKDILEVWNKNPYLDRTARKIPYNLIDSKIYLNVDEFIYNNEVHVLEKKSFVPYTETSTDIPAIFENYLTSAILSDFYRGDGQADQAGREDNRAEEFLLRQIDRVEKLQQQNKPTIQSYNNQSQNSLIYQ